MSLTHTCVFPSSSMVRTLPSPLLLRLTGTLCWRVVPMVLWLHTLTLSHLFCTLNHAACALLWSLLAEQCILLVLRVKLTRHVNYGGRLGPTLRFLCTLNYHSLQHTAKVSCLYVLSPHMIFRITCLFTFLQPKQKKCQCVFIQAGV